MALLRGEIDAITNSDDFYARNPEWIEKKMVDFHVVMEIPKGEKHPLFSRLPEIETFAKTERGRKLLSMFRLFRLSGSPFILPPATQKDRAEIIKEAIRKSFKDPEFVKEYRKVVGEDPTPLLPEENERAIRELPRDPETIELFKKFAGAVRCRRCKIGLESSNRSIRSTASRSVPILQPPGSSSRVAGEDEGGLERFERLERFEP